MGQLTPRSVVAYNCPLVEISLISKVGQDVEFSHGSTTAATAATTAATAATTAATKAATTATAV